MRPRAQSFLALVLVLALCSALFSFNLSAYLYPTENASSVTSAVLPSTDGVTYVLYTIGGVPSLLTANDTPISDEGAIQSVLTNAYSAQDLPSSTESAAMQADLTAFNDSRNAKDQYTGTYGIEDYCLQTIGQGISPCNDTASCANTANYVCELEDENAGGPGSSGCEADILTSPILDYVTDVAVFNANVPIIQNDLSGFTLDNVGGRISEMQTALTNLQNASVDIAGNILRNPDAGDTCPQGGTDGCIGLCPSTELDTNALADLSAQLSNISSRLGPAFSISSTATQIASSTQSRIAYQQSAALAAIWQPQWDAFQTQYGGLQANVSTMALYINDPNFTSSYATFEKAWSSLAAMSSSHNWTGVQDDLAAAQQAVPALQAALVSGTKPYQTALLAQNHAGDVLKEARWSVLSSTDKTQIAAYNALVTRKNALDAAFAPPLTSAQYAALTRNYTALQADASTFLASLGQTTGLTGQIGEQFGQASINGVYSLTDALVSVSPGTRSQMAPIIPPVVLALGDLAIVSIALLVFIGGLFYMRPMMRSRIALGAWVSALFIFLFLLGTGSVIMFVLINQSAASGNVGDWVNLLQVSNHSYVGIDQAGAPADALAAMANCSANISGQIQARFAGTRPVTVFTYSGTSCTLNNATQTLAQCLDKINGLPVMYLHYNATSAVPRFSVIYAQQADIYYDTADYNSCDIGDVLD